jgi:putative flippase GtrA
MSALGYGVRAARVLRFGFVGGLATVTYAMLATVFVGAGIAPVPASVFAYGAGGVVSYVGHKMVTFRSSAGHASELPKFIATFVAGLALAIAAPGVLTERLGFP